MRINTDGYFKYTKLAVDLLSSLQAERNCPQTANDDHKAALNKTNQVGELTAAVISQYQSPFSFCRIVDRHVEGGVYLFGTKFKLPSFKELQIVGAKLVDGDWIPDEAKPITSFRISDEMLCNMLVSSASHTEGSPITITQVGDYNITSPQEPYVSANEQFSQELLKKNERILTNLNTLKNLLAPAVDGNVRFNKSLHEEVKKTLNLIESNALDNLQYDLASIAKNMQSDMTSVYVSIVSTLNSISRKDWIELEDRSSGRNDSDVEKIYQHNFGHETAQLIEKLVSDIENFIEVKAKRQHSELTDINRIYEMKRFFKAYATNEERVNYPHQGLVSLSTTSDGFSEFFGDKKTQTGYVSFKVQWASINPIESSEPSFSNLCSIVDFRLTPRQYLELMQSSSTKQWVKGTVDRFLNHCTDKSHFKTYGHDELTYEGIDMTWASQAQSDIRQVIEDINSQLSNSSQSKQKRERLSESLINLEKLVRAITEGREEPYNQALGELSNAIIQSSTKDVERAVNSIVANRPELEEFVSKLLLPNQ